MAQSITYEPAQAKEDEEMSDHDRRLLDSPEILASVKQGLADSAAGRVRKRQSYAEHAADTLED